MPDSTLTILQDAREFNSLLDDPAKTPAGTILTFDLELHLVLERLGVKHLTPWDLIGTDDHPRLEQLAADARALWQHHAVIEHRGINLLQIARHRHIACLTRLVWLGHVLERAFELVKPKRVIVFGQDTAHGLEQPPDCTRLPLLSATVQSIARAFGAAPSVRRNPTASPHQDIAATQADAANLPPADPALFAEQPFILFSGNGDDLGRQLPFIREVQAQRDVRAIQVYRFANEATLNRLQDNGHALLHESQIQHGFERSNIDAVTNTARRDFENALNAAHDSQSIARWIPPSHLDFVFGDYAKRMALHVDRWSAFFEAHRPESVVAMYPTPCLEVAHRRRIETLILPHGGLSIGDAAWYRAMPNCKLGVTGAAHVDRLHAHGIDHERIQVVGTAMPQSVRTQTKRQSDRWEILLVTSRFADHAHDAELPSLNWKAGVEAIKQLFAITGRHEDWTVSIRTHPRYDHLELYEHLVATMHERARMSVGESLAESVETADIVVFPFITSSTIVEASVFGKPVILLRDPNVNLAANGRDALLQGWPHVENLPAMEALIETLRTDESAYQSAVARTVRAYRSFHGQAGSPRSFSECVLRKKKAPAAGERDQCLAT